MDESNHWYGHSRIIGRYCELAEDTPRRIQGFLQHGWNYLHGFPPNDHWCSPGYPRFVWSDVLRRRGWSMGRRGHYVIGAPWIYLLDMEPEKGRRPRKEGYDLVSLPRLGKAFGQRRPCPAGRRNIRSGVGAGDNLSLLVGIR